MTGRNENVLHSTSHAGAGGWPYPTVWCPCEFQEMESRRRRGTYFGSLLERTDRERFESHADAVSARADALGVRHKRVDTGEDFFDNFGRVWIG